MMDSIGVQPKEEVALKQDPIASSADKSKTQESALHFQGSKAERWNSLRQWIGNRLEDEKATPMTRLPPAKKESLHPMHDLSAEELASFRARRISVTVQKESHDSKWGFSLEQHASETRVQIKRMAQRCGTLLKYAPFQPGDILVSVNGQLCTDAATTIQRLVKMECGFPITLLVETPQGVPDSLQVVVHKPAMSTLGIQFFSSREPPDQGMANSNDHTNGNIGNSTLPQEYKDVETLATSRIEGSLLRIKGIEPTGILAHSPLSPGDIVVAINATPCSQVPPLEANSLLYQSTESITIIAITPSPNRQQQWLRHARRAGVAIGGGTMVGIGLIFIPTLPPPFGEALLVSGVSVLGTEFETPKRIMKSARDSFERIVSSDDEEPLSMEDDENDNASNNTEFVARQGQPSNTSRSMKGRAKTFGRRHVLPLLNQAVGDRPQATNDNG